MKPWQQSPWSPTPLYFSFDGWGSNLVDGCFDLFGNDSLNPFNNWNIFQKTVSNSVKKKNGHLKYTQKAVLPSSWWSTFEIKFLPVRSIFISLSYISKQKDMRGG